MHLLQHQGDAVGHAQAFEIDHRRRERELECGRHPLAGILEARRDHPRLWLIAPPPHLLGEAQRAGEVAIDWLAKDGRATSAGPFDSLFASQLAEGAADRDEAAAIPFRKLTLRRQSLAGCPLARIEGRSQILVDLVM